MNNLCRKTVNNFSNNTEQKIILCRILKIVYAEKSEQFLSENNEHDVASTVA